MNPRNTAHPARSRDGDLVSRMNPRKAAHPGGEAVMGI